MNGNGAELQNNDMPYAEGHNFEDAVQALEKQLKDGVESALHGRTFSVDELRQELGL